MISQIRAVVALACACVLFSSGGALAESARFIQVIKNETPGTRLHLSELEAFSVGVVPDDLGGATFGGMSTSSNDIGDGTLITYGSGNLVPTVGTSSSIQHGAANENPNNALESGGAVWSINDGQATNSQYTLDLGATFDVTTVRMWPRADGCCVERWRNLEVNLYADDGAGNPGALIASSDDGRLTDPGGNVPLELTFAVGSTAIEELGFTPAFTYPTESDPAVLSSVAADHLVGTVSALNEFGGSIPSATFALVAGAGDTNNGLYELDGTNELRLIGDLSGLDGVEHSVLVRASTDEGDLDQAFTFTVLLDSDNDDLIDSWELMFGALIDFMTGGDSDGDGEKDEEEFREGTDPSVADDALLVESFNFDNGGFVEEATGNSPIPSVHSTATGTWSMAGDDSGPATNTLTSPEITVPVTGGIRVSFDHRYSIEPEWDGTALQVSIDGGPFLTVPHTSFTANGYTFFGLIGNHVLGGGDGFNGDSPGYFTPAFITSVAEVGGVPAGGTITIRFLGAWDEGAKGAGNPNWDIDSVVVDILPDQDNDGMPDSYEEANDLNETVNDAAGDLDSDTVSNLDEFLARTDPNDNDTDDDDLLDGVETGTGVFVSASDTGTDPLLADTDGDGRTDGEEVEGGGGFTSDPNKLDTDEDGVDDGTEVERMTDPNDPDDTPVLWTVRNAKAGVALNNIQNVRDLFAPGGSITEETVTQEDVINFRENANGPIQPQEAFPLIGTQGTDTNDFAILATGSIVTEEAGIYTFGFNSDDGGGLWIDGEPVVLADVNRGSTTSVGAVNLSLGQHEVEFIYWERGGGAQVQLFAANEIGDQTGLGTDNATVVDNYHLLETSSFPDDDTDGDGLPDAYEETLFPGDLTKLGPGDFDGDTVNDPDEYANGTDPTERDTDGDGLDDNVEDGGGTFVDATMTGTDPRNADSDDDGISDGEEISGTNGFVTKPNDPDSDGDGFKDGAEVGAGSNPNDPGSIPPVTLLAYFNFDGQLVDQAGNSPDLTLNGAAALTAGGMGINGEAIDFGAVNDGSFASVPEGSHLDLATANNAMSVALWQNINTVGNTSAFWIIAPDSNNGQRGFQAHIPWSNGTVFFDQSGCCVGPQRLTVANVHMLDQWQHFVFQRNADGEREIWVDGVLAASAGGAEPLDPFNGRFNIGSDGGGGNSMAGLIDDFAIFSDALTPEQIAELAAGATPLDLIGPPILFQILEVQLDQATDTFTLTWNSRPDRDYGVYYSTDLIDFGADVNDSVASEGETTTFEFENPEPGSRELFFRIQEN